MGSREGESLLLVNHLTDLGEGEEVEAEAEVGVEAETEVGVEAEAEVGDETEAEEGDEVEVGEGAEVGEEEAMLTTRPTQTQVVFTL